MDDEALVRRFKETRDREWFAELFRRHRRQIYCSCLSVLKNSADAEDVVIETFLQAFKEIDKYHEDRFLGWLQQIARRRCLNLLKTAVRRHESASLEDVDAGHQEAKDLFSQAEDVDAVMRQLSNPQRLCLSLCYFEGFSYREIASATGYSEKDVKSHLQNGRRSFRIFWTPEEGR